MKCIWMIEHTYSWKLIAFVELEAIPFYAVVSLWSSKKWKRWVSLVVFTILYGISQCWTGSLSAVLSNAIAEHMNSGCNSRKLFIIMSDDISLKCWSYGIGLQKNVLELLISTIHFTQSHYHINSIMQEHYHRYLTFWISTTQFIDHFIVSRQ